MILIDPVTRQFTIPGADLTFGVESDSGSERKYFQCPRYVGNNLDLMSCFVRMNYRNANGEMDSYLVEDVTVDGDNVVFSWVLSQKVTKYKGLVKFVVCAVGPNQKVEWHTTLGSGQVLEGLEPDIAVEAGTADVVAQLIAMVEAQTAAVEAEGATQIKAVQAAAEAAEAAAVAQIEAKGVSTLATIPEDYTAIQSAVRGAANAIRGKVSGEVIRVDDVSPMEHYPVVKVSGKNLIPYPFAKNGNTNAGGTFTALTDGGISGSGTPVSYCDMYLYNGEPLAKNGSITVSLSGTRTNIVATVAIYDDAGNELVSKNIDQSPIRLNLDEYKTATRWLVLVKRKTDNVEMSGTVYLQIERGDTATEYTPYIDPTTVTVTRCGKNLLPYPFTDKTVTRKGVTFTDNGDGTITINGTAEATTSFVLFNGEMPVNGKYTFSGLSGGGGSTYYIQPICSDKAYPGLTDGSKTYEWSGITLNRLQITVVGGTVFSNTKVALMLEIGDTASEFEPYSGETQIPASDGTVSGLAAVSPTMTLLTDTTGVNIECEYSRDTNKVITEILEKIAALAV